jgi:hypothetical protein
VGIAVDNAYNIVEFAITYKINYPLLVGGATALGVIRALGNAGGGLPYTMTPSGDRSWQGCLAKMPRSTANNGEKAAFLAFSPDLEEPRWTSAS